MTRIIIISSATKGTVRFYKAHHSLFNPPVSEVLDLAVGALSGNITRELRPVDLEIHSHDHAVLS